MVATLGLQKSATKVVAAAVVAMQTAAGNEVLDIPLLEMVHVSVALDVAAIPSIVSVSDRVAELVVDSGPFEAIAPAVWALAARGWDVVTLSPSGRMGEAHRTLRGTPSRLQPWWLEESMVCFGAFETP